VGHDDELRDTNNTVQLAHDADDTNYSPWSPSMFRLYLVLSCSYLCGCLNGYDGLSITPHCKRPLTYNF